VQNSGPNLCKQEIQISNDICARFELSCILLNDSVLHRSGNVKCRDLWECGLPHPIF
jgi:hypothetical protein